MKKKILLIVEVIALVNIFNISAKALDEGDAYFENSNGVILTEKEYNWVKTIYDENYLNIMTQIDYETNILPLDIENRDVYYDIEEENISDFIQTRATVKQTNYKRWAISGSCDNGLCYMTTVLTWLINPAVRSYDLIGARFNGTSLASDTITTTVTYEGGGGNQVNYQRFSNGFGNSVILPAHSGNIYVVQSFRIYQGGTTFASYQHAIKNISLANSKKYTISSSGYGGVFLPYGSAVDVYDEMSGVVLTLL